LLFTTVHVRSWHGMIDCKGVKELIHIILLHLRIINVELDKFAVVTRKVGRYQVDASSIELCRCANKLGYRRLRKHSQESVG
jgi:hypothetical protein